MPGNAGDQPTPSPTVGRTGERALLARIRARVPPAPPWVLVGIGDDAAVVEPARNTLDVLTTDALVEGVHFDRRFSTAADVGWRAVAVNLSDLAAMGAAPRAALLSLALPADLPLADFDELLDGALAAAAAHGLALVGGNITRSPGPLVVDVTATGSVHRRRILTRSGAQPGDELYVSGTVGAATTGLAWLRGGGTDAAGTAGPGTCADRYRRPEPRVRLGVLVGRNRAASACVDLSDGLADGVHQLAEASGLGATLDAGAIPVDPVARAWWTARGQDPVAAALVGGDDYELLFSVPRRARRRFLASARLARGVAVSQIGTMTAGAEILLRRDGASEPVPRGFAHFAPVP